MMNIKEYEYLWTTKKNDWVLVNTAFGYDRSVVIFDYCGAIFAS